MRNTATLVGNLIDNPELRYTRDGTPVASLSLAASRRVRRDGQWADQLDGYFAVTCFSKLAEHACDSLHKGPGDGHRPAGAVQLRRPQRRAPHRG